jgi:hypothetical protein
MSGIANELFNLRELIRIKASNGKGQFKCLLNRERVLEAVWLGSCEARLCKELGTLRRVVVFRRDPETALVWHLQQIANPNRTVWCVEEMRNQRTFTTEELAQKILSRLKDYWKKHRDMIRFVS